MRAGTPLQSAAADKTIHETFLINDAKYKASKLNSVRFPPNSGDINPIENVWSWLRTDLAKREFDDLKDKAVITVAQFRQRAAQILNSYAEAKPGEKHSRLRKLVRGMPDRPQKCKRNKYGPTGK